MTDDTPFAICQSCSGPIWSGGMAITYMGKGGDWLWVHRFASTCAQVEEDREAQAEKRPVQ